VKELFHSIFQSRNVAVGLGKGIAHIPIGIGMFGLMELARAYEDHQASNARI